MKLILYGGDEANSRELNQLALKISGEKRPRITYIPASSYFAEGEFVEFVNSYKREGVEKFILFPVDVPFDAPMMELALDSDIIHLAGGNTFYFLNNLRKSKMLGKLRKFVKEGGVLTGCSAGAILMSPTIEGAKYPNFESDDNEEGIKNLKSLNLVKFDFCPHYKNSSRYDKELKKWSKKTALPLYACSDGHGIVIEGEQTTFIGPNYCFFKGQKVSGPR